MPEEFLYANQLIVFDGAANIVIRIAPPIPKRPTVQRSLIDDMLQVTLNGASWQDAMDSTIEEVH